MPGEAEHREAAEANENLAGAFLVANQASPSWAIVLAFYSALHWVEAYFAQAGLHAQTHQQRDREVGKRLPAIYDAYRTLNGRSREARYDLLPFTESEARELIEIELAMIKAHVGGLLR